MVTTKEFRNFLLGCLILLVVVICIETPLIGNVVKIFEQKEEVFVPVYAATSTKIAMNANEVNHQDDEEENIVDIPIVTASRFGSRRSTSTPVVEKEIVPPKQEEDIEEDTVPSGPMVVPEVVTVIESENVNTKDITKPCGLSASELNLLINTTMENKGIQDVSRFYNKGQVFYDAEQEYSVNALYILSMYSLESGWGRSELIYARNNPGGFLTKNGGKYFNTLDEGLEYGFSLIRSGYLDRRGFTTLEEISYVYCPPTAVSWTGKVYNILNHYVQILNGLK